MPPYRVLQEEWSEYEEETDEDNHDEQEHVDTNEKIHKPQRSVSSPIVDIEEHKVHQIHNLNTLHNQRDEGPLDVSATAPSTNITQALPPATLSGGSRVVVKQEEWVELIESSGDETQSERHQEDTIEVSHTDTIMKEEPTLAHDEIADFAGSAHNPRPHFRTNSDDTSRSQSDLELQHAMPNIPSYRDFMEPNGLSDVKALATPRSDQRPRRHGDSHAEEASPPVYAVIRANVPVFEMKVKGILVMRRQSDSWMNATSILKAAGVREEQLRRRILRTIKGPQESVQGGRWFYQGTWVPCAFAHELASRYGIANSLLPLFEIAPTEGADVIQGAKLSANSHSAQRKSTSSAGSRKPPVIPVDDNGQRHGALASREDWVDSSDSEDELSPVVFDSMHDSARPMVTSDVPHTRAGFVDMNSKRKRLSEPQDYHADQAAPERKRARTASPPLLPLENSHLEPRERGIRYAQGRRNEEFKAVNKLRSLVPPQYFDHDSGAGGQYNRTTRTLMPVIAYLEDLAKSTDSSRAPVSSFKTSDNDFEDVPSIGDLSQTSSQLLSRTMVDALLQPETTIATSLHQYGHGKKNSNIGHGVGPRKTEDKYSTGSSAAYSRGKRGRQSELAKWFDRRELADSNEVQRRIEKVKVRVAWEQLTDGEKDKIRKDERARVLHKRFEEGKSQSYFLSQLMSVANQCGVSDGDVLGLFLQQRKPRDTLIELFDGVVEVDASGTLSLCKPDAGALMHEQWGSD
nr:transcriptional regulator swi6 [Exophiala xenobiotica]